MLVAGDDAIIIDFEGEPLKPLAERRTKSSPLRDVAGMLRSFDYVSGMIARGDLLKKEGEAAVSASRILDEFAETAGQAFLEGYAIGRGTPLTMQEQSLLSVFALEKAAYEIAYEENNRPDWIDLPLRGFIKLAKLIVGAQ